MVEPHELVQAIAARHRSIAVQGYLELLDIPIYANHDFRMISTELECLHVVFSSSGQFFRSKSAACFVPIDEHVSELSHALSQVL